jgi:tetratricopeptide (TPR) repeat protein
LAEEASVGEGAAILAYHWVRAGEWDRALNYTLDAAERARKLLARPEAINHYWQALELIERTPPTSERARVHCDVILSLVQLPGWIRDEEAEVRLLRHVDQALTNATQAGQIANMARLEAVKGRYQDNEALLERAIGRAEGSGDRLAEAFASANYGNYLGVRGQFEASLGHFDRAIEIWGAQGEQLLQARAMAASGRCYYARAGKLDQALAFARRAREIAGALNNAELRAWCAMEAEVYVYRGLWDEAVLVAEEALPVAWKIGEWSVVFFSSAWLAIAYLNLGQSDKARRVLDRVFNEAPARIYKGSAYAIPYAQITRAQVHLITGDYNSALSTVLQASAVAERCSFRLEEAAAHRVLGQIHQAMGDRTEADAAFRRSLEVLDAIQSPPELAQTLLAYGRFRLGDNSQEDRALIERALRLFEGMKATGWIEEARAALAAASPV